MKSTAIFGMATEMPALAAMIRFGLSLSCVTSCYSATSTFQQEALPIFEKRCIVCHGATKPTMGRLDLQTLEGVMADGSKGAVVVSRQAGREPLVDARPRREDADGWRTRLPMKRKWLWCKHVGGGR
jgi:hypothetical protein